MKLCVAYHARSYHGRTSKHEILICNAEHLQIILRFSNQLQDGAKINPYEEYQKYFMLLVL